MILCASHRAQVELCGVLLDHLDAMNRDDHYLITSQTHIEAFLFHANDNTLAIVVA